MIKLILKSDQVIMQNLISPVSFGLQKSQDMLTQSIENKKSWKYQFNPTVVFTCICYLSFINLLISVQYTSTSIEIRVDNYEG